MKIFKTHFDRRRFIQISPVVAIGTGSNLFADFSNQEMEREDNINVIGPKAGYSPQIGTLVSMLNWMRAVVLASVEELSREALDYLHDSQSNTIGGMLLHLAATERFYQINTFEGRKWGNWDEKDKEKWSVAMELGEKARKEIKGNELNYYTEILTEVRQKTLAELKNRDDKWLLSVDESFGWGPTNNYCKWFHVCEHESNHNGQIKWLKRRLA